MSAFSIAFVTGLLSLPLAALAQTTDPAPPHRLYVGVAAYEGNNQSVRGFYSGERFNIPVQVTLGYQLRPRLALQVGLAYSGIKSSSANTYEYVGSNAVPVTYVSTNKYVRRATSTSLLARYTLTRKASHRFQADVVGGFSFDHLYYSNSQTDTYTSTGATNDSHYDYSGTFNNLLVNAGPSFRYRFGERLEGVYDILFNTSLTGSYHNLNTAMALGLRYRFGPR